MKAGTLTSKRLWLPVLAMGMTIALASWDYKQSPTGQDQQENPSDTIPPKKKIKSDKKVRDLDEALLELEMLDMDAEMEKVKDQLAKAMKEIDGEKIRLEVEKSLREVDFNKIRDEITNALKEVDLEKIRADVQESVAKIDWDKMKKELEEAQKVDFSKMEAEMKEMQEELKKIGPRIKEELANVEVDMKKAKEEIEKAKGMIREYKTFVDGLEKDGLINKKENYTIKHEDGVLTVNGKKVADPVYNKYRTFLEKHKKFSIEKDRDDFDFDED